MEVDKMLNDLELLDKNFAWTNEEVERLDKKITVAFDNDNMDEVNRLRDKFLELENRHQYNRKIYFETLKKCRLYFKNKYDIDISSLFNF
jgi:uncharacterized protein YdcH (DUF465 family)